MQNESTDGVWYPGELTPHLYYIDQEVVAMATAVLPKIGESQKWLAFDMRYRNDLDSGPLLLGQYETLLLAKQKIEEALGKVVN